MSSPLSVRYGVMELTTIIIIIIDGIGTSRGHRNYKQLTVDAARDNRIREAVPDSHNSLCE